MIFFTSDLHFGHAAVIKYCNRPFASLDEMHATLIANWNAKVNDNDTVYVLGDLALCPYKDFEPLAMQLRGKKILIQGNHDKYSLGQYQKLGFQVFQELKIKLAGHVVRMSHYPYAYPWYRLPFAYASERRFMEKRPPKIPGEILMHGHTHTKKRLEGNRFHVGVDAWGFSPVSLSEFESTVASAVRTKCAGKD